MNKQELLTRLFFEKGYRVTKEGKIFNSRGKERKLSKANNGYCSINIRPTNGGSTRVFVHRLQAYQKYGDKIFKKEIEVRHKNGNPTDNSWDNILIGNHSQNMMDIPKHKRRENSSSPKYPHYEIIKDRKLGLTYKELMLKYNIPSTGTLSFILNKSMEKERQIASGR